METEGADRARSEAHTRDTGVPLQVSQAVRQIQDMTQNLRRDLSFEVDEESGRVIIQVYDAETQKLIRTIPPEETRAMMPDIEDLAGSVKQGLFVKISA